VVISCLAHERAALMIASALFTMTILKRFPYTYKKNDLWLFFFAFLALTYSLSFMIIIQNNSDYGSFGASFFSFPGQFLENENFRNASIKFLLINLPLLLAGFFSRWFLIVAIGSMIPNLVGNIGGAEKLGWSTHYHSLYFPFLVAAATIGFSKIFEPDAVMRPKLMAAGVILAMTGYLAKVDLYDTQRFFYFADRLLAQNTSVKLVKTVAGLEGGFVKGAGNQYRSLSEVIPENASVATSEAFMPALVNGKRTVHYFPLGLDSAEYVVSWFEKTQTGEVLYSAAVTYLGAENKTKLDSCLTRRIDEQGFVLSHSVNANQHATQGVAVLRRNAR